MKTVLMKARKASYLEFPPQQALRWVGDHEPDILHGATT